MSLAMMGCRAELLSALCAASLLVATATSRALADSNENLAVADRFFMKYKEAARLLSRNQPQDAVIVMNLLARVLNSSPWMEIAMLKHCQLIESANDALAEEGYLLLRQRVLNAPYFQGDTKRAKLFGVALQGAVDAGITRLRIGRVRVALERYRAKYLEYPESLTKLAILGYIGMENIHDAKDESLRYVPTMPQITPFVSYKRYDGLEAPVADPFVASSPPLE